MNLMTLRSAVMRMRLHNPGTVQEALDCCRLTLTYLNEGMYRKVYLVEGLDAVLKVPIRAHGSIKAPSLDHARQEYQSWKELRKKQYAAIHKYLPEIHYFNSNTGVSLVRRYNLVAKGNQKRGQQMYKEVYKRIGTAPNLDEQRLNVGEDPVGNLKLLDLGMVKPRFIGRD